MHFFSLAPLTAAILIVPAAAAAQPVESTIVVRAPAGLQAAAAKEWTRLNKDAQKIAKRLIKLRAEAQDDREDVAEAERALRSAQDKLGSERKDQARTAERLAQAQAAMTAITERRGVLKTGN